MAQTVTILHAFTAINASDTYRFCKRPGPLTSGLAADQVRARAATDDWAELTCKLEGCEGCVEKPECGKTREIRVGDVAGATVPDEETIGPVA